MTKEELRKLVVDEWNKGYLVFQTIEGINKCKMEDFVKQPVDGQLYDINRDYATCMTLLGEETWLNNLAAMRLIEYYYDRCNHQPTTLKTSRLDSQVEKSENFKSGD